MSAVIIPFPTGKIHTGHLVDVAMDRTLEDFVVLCFWENGDISTGFSGGVTLEQFEKGHAELLVKAKEYFQEENQ